MFAIRSSLAILSLRRVPFLDPERAWILVTGRGHAFQPFRQNEGTRAEIERDDRQLLGVELLDSAPQCLVLVLLADDLHRIQRAVHLRIVESGVVLARPAIPGGGDHRRMQGRAGAVLRRSEEHTSELQSLMRSSYAVFCLKK